MHPLHLLPVAFFFTSSSTVLHTVGLATPHWFQGKNSLGTYYYGVFLFCRHPQGCQSWATPDKEDIPKRKQTRTIDTADISASQVILGINMMALLVSDGILVWYLWKAPTRYWAKNALSSTVSGVIYGVTGTTLFMTVRTSMEDEPVSLGWSAIVVITAVICQVLAAGCIYLPLRLKIIQNFATESSTSLQVSVPIDEHSTSLNRESPATSWHKLMKTDPIRNSLTSVDRDGLYNREQTGTELLRMLQSYQQGDITNGKLRLTRVVTNRSGEDSHQPRREMSVEEECNCPPSLLSARRSLPCSSKEPVMEPALPRPNEATAFTNRGRITRKGEDAKDMRTPMEICPEEGPEVTDDNQ